MASLPGSVKCLFCNGAVNFMQGGKDKFYKHLGGEHDIHVNHNLIMAINFLDKETLGEIVTQFSASYTSEASNNSNMPSSVSCILCNAAVNFTQGGKENFFNHLKGEHDIFLNEDLVLAINFLDQETLQEIVKQFEMSYTSIVTNGEGGEDANGEAGEDVNGEAGEDVNGDVGEDVNGGLETVEEGGGLKTIISQEDLMMEALKEAEKLKNAAAKNIKKSRDIIDVDDTIEESLITLDDEPMLLEPPAKKKYKSFECSVCLAPFDYAWMLSTHMKSHEEKKTKFECSQCGKTFDSSSNLQRHTNFEHKNNNARKAVPDPPKRFNPNNSLPVTQNKLNQNRRSSMDVSRLTGLKSTSISKSTNITKVANLNQATNISKVTVDRTMNTSLSRVGESISITAPGPKGSKVATSINAARDVAAKSVAEKQKLTMAALSRVGVSVSKASPKKAAGLNSAISITKVEPPPPPKASRVIHLDSKGMDNIRKWASEKTTNVTPPAAGRPLKRNNPLSITPNPRNVTVQGNQTNPSGPRANASAQRTPYQRNAPGSQGNVPVQIIKPVLKTPSEKDAAQGDVKDGAASSESEHPTQGRTPAQGRVPMLNKTIKTIMPQKPALKSCEVCKKQFPNNELLSKHILSCVSGEIRGVAKASKNIVKKGSSDVNVQNVLKNGKTGQKEIVNSDLAKPVDKVIDSSKSEVRVKVEDPLSIATGNKENAEVLDNLNDIISMLEENSDVDKVDNAKVDSTPEADNKNAENNDLDMEVTDNIEMEAQ